MLLRLVLLLPVIGASLRLLGFKRSRDLLAWLSRPSGSQSPAHLPATTVETAHRIARLVSIAAYHGPYRATCLRQSLALWWLLRRRGIAAELRIGVRKDGGELQAHAWVEHNGQALNDVQGTANAYAAFSPIAVSTVDSQA